jgi:transglutaminase-like putative cysteine protease
LTPGTGGLYWAAALERTNLMNRVKRRATVTVGLLLAGVELACNVPIPTQLLHATATATPVSTPTPVPTPTEVASASPTPEEACVRKAAFVSDLTVLDNTIFSPGQEFVKVWELRNNGACAWDAGVRLAFQSGDHMGGPESVPVPPVDPGETTTISVTLLAPDEPATYRGDWQLTGSDGVPFGPQVWVQIVVPGAGGGVAELFLLQGTFAQETVYTYTVEFDRGSESTIDYSMAGVRTFSQTGHSQAVATHDIVGEPALSSTSQGTDPLGNEYYLLHWDSTAEHLTARRIVQLTTTTAYGPILTTAAYPLPPGTIGGDLADFLEPTSQMQSDDPSIRAKADELVAGATTELEAVVRIVNWVRHNTEFACPRCEGITYADAVMTLQELRGNCVNFANLAGALIRAAGIPCRRVFGFVADRDQSYAGHAWIAVYYPDLGWVEYETSNWMPAYGDAPTTFLLPQHITILHYGGGSPFSSSVSGMVDELHESSYVVTERPAEVSSVTVHGAPGQTVGYVITLRQDWISEIGEYAISLGDVPAGWSAALSDTLLTIDPDDASRTRDVLVTVTIPSSSPVAAGTICVLASSGGEAVASVDLTVTLSP